MSWQVAVFTVLALVLVGGFAWYERSRPPPRLVALVAALAALAVAGRLVLAPIPNVVATTDIALITGYALGGRPGVRGRRAGRADLQPLARAGAVDAVADGRLGPGRARRAQGSPPLTGRRLGRWGLATACGVAGLAYGALLDLSVMVTYGGEQSLDRYLALSARGRPLQRRPRGRQLRPRAGRGPGAGADDLALPDATPSSPGGPPAPLSALLAALALVAGPRLGEPPGAGAEASAAAPGAAGRRPRRAAPGSRARRTPTAASAPRPSIRRARR